MYHLYHHKTPHNQKMQQQPAGDPLPVHVPVKDKGDIVLALLAVSIVVVSVFIIFIMAALACLGGAWIWMIRH
jgi:hypothetical protein